MVDGDLVKTKEEKIVINAERVDSIFRECLFKNEEMDDEGQPQGIKPLKVQGIANDVGFHADRIQKHRSEIISFLEELPHQFREDSGGGWSFLNLCQTEEGEQWTGLHRIMEQLVCLGIAIGKVSYCLPKKMWPALPGGVPFIVIKK